MILKQGIMFTDILALCFFIYAFCLVWQAPRPTNMMWKRSVDAETQTCHQKDDIVPEEEVSIDTNEWKFLRNPSPTDDASYESLVEHLETVTRPLYVQDSIHNDACISR